MWGYEGRVCDAVVAAKFARHGTLADAIGRRLGRRILADEILADEDCDLPEVVTSIPSHWTRRITRGGTGVTSIAAIVAGMLGRPYRNLLTTTRRIEKQAWLSDAERLANVHGAFSVKYGYDSFRRSGIINQHILVVDDVLTTGATANEISRTLKAAGARRVTLAIVARAVHG